MDPIEQQIQDQIDAIRMNENFQSYQPSFSDIGIAPINNTSMSLFPQRPPVGGVKEMAKNIVRNKAIDFAARKAGITNPAILNQIPVLGGIMQSVSVPAIALTGIAAVKNKIANRGMNATINRESTRDLQQRIDKGEFGSNQPTAQDRVRGGNTEVTGRAASDYMDL